MIVYFISMKRREKKREKMKKKRKKKKKKRPLDLSVHTLVVSMRSPDVVLHSNIIHRFHVINARSSLNYCPSVFVRLQINIPYVDVRPNVISQRKHLFTKRPPCARSSINCYSQSKRSSVTSIRPTHVLLVL